MLCIRRPQNWHENPYADKKFISETSQTTKFPKLSKNLVPLDIRTLALSSVGELSLFKTENMRNLRKLLEFQARKRHLVNLKLVFFLSYKGPLLPSIAIRIESINKHGKTRQVSIGWCLAVWTDLFSYQTTYFRHLTESQPKVELKFIRIKFSTVFIGNRLVDVLSLVLQNFFASQAPWPLERSIPKNTFLAWLTIILWSW